MSCHRLTCLAGLLAALAAVPALAATATATSAAAAGAATTQIFQQRTTDGRILITDRPYPGATTERAWQLPATDPAAERQRALDVRQEALAVSERVQRSLDRQQQRVADDMAMQQRFAANEPGRFDVAPGEVLLGSGAVFPGVFPNRGRYGRYDGRYDRRSDHRFDNRIGSPPRRDSPWPGGARFRGSAAPGNR